MEIEELLVKLNFNGEEAKKGMNAVVSDLHGISENAKDSFLHAGSEVKSSDTVMRMGPLPGGSLEPSATVLAWVTLPWLNLSNASPKKVAMPNAFFRWNV